MSQKGGGLRYWKAGYFGGRFFRERCFSGVISSSLVLEKKTSEELPFFCQI